MLRRCATSIITGGIQSSRAAPALQNVSARFYHEKVRILVAA